jgi:hypothetical protein
LIQLFDATTIDSLEWPNTEEGAYARRFLKPLIKNNISHYVNNITGDVYALKIDDLIFPIIVAHENYKNSHVCSSYGQYITYAKDSLQLVGHPLFAKLLKTLIDGLGKIVRAGHIDRAVYVNHWLFATNLYPDNLSSHQLSVITDFLKRHFPSHAIIFRSLNSRMNALLIDSLKENGFNLIASRQVYLTDTKNKQIFDTRIFKSDLRLSKSSPYRIVDEENIRLEESSKLLHLHHSLYLDQHSYLNPQLNIEFLQLLLQERLLRFKVLKLDDCIKGVAGYFEQEGVMLSLFFGYEKTDPEHATIYRLLNTSLLLEAQKKGVMYHQGSGAGFYKTIRRAESHLDSMAIYTKHLPSKQKASWALLRNFINTFGPRYMKKY